MSGPHEPGDALEAARRLEAGLGEARARAREDPPPELGLDPDQHRALVEDLEVLVELVGSSWRQTREEIQALTAELADLRRLADEARAALRDVRFELRLVRSEAAGEAGSSPGGSPGSIV
jgi:hypothetical protein